MMDVLRDPGIASVRCFGFFKYPKIYCYKKQNDVFRIRAFQEELSDCDRFPTKAKAAVRLVKKKKKLKTSSLGLGDVKKRSGVEREMMKSKFKTNNQVVPV